MPGIESRHVPTQYKLNTYQDLRRHASSAGYRLPITLAGRLRITAAYGTNRLELDSEIVAPIRLRIRACIMLCSITQRRSGLHAVRFEANCSANRRGRESQGKSESGRV